MVYKKKKASDLSEEEAEVSVDSSEIPQVTVQSLMMSPPPSLSPAQASAQVSQPNHETRLHLNEQEFNVNKFIKKIIPIIVIVLFIMIAMAGYLTYDGARTEFTIERANINSLLKEYISNECNDLFIDTEKCQLIQANIEDAFEWTSELIKYGIKAIEENWKAVPFGALLYLLV